MDLTAYRQSAREQARIADLLRLLPESCRSILDIGARDGHVSRLLAERGLQVTALDLETPVIDHPGIRCVKGDATRLQFADGAFDAVLCAEVLEHVPALALSLACTEIARVARVAAIIGVPFRQDLRVGRTRCASCGARNPPWGHVNTFDEARLVSLFHDLRLREVSFVGTNRDRTNAATAFFMDLADNPYGTYDQEEPCVHCGQPLGGPPRRSFLQKMYSKAGMTIALLQRPFIPSRPAWIHAAFYRS